MPHPALIALPVVLPRLSGVALASCSNLTPDARENRTIALVSSLRVDRRVGVRAGRRIAGGQCRDRKARMVVTVIPGVFAMSRNAGPMSIFLGVLGCLSAIWQTLQAREHANGSGVGSSIQQPDTALC